MEWGEIEDKYKKQQQSEQGGDKGDLRIVSPDSRLGVLHEEQGCNRDFG